MKQNSAHPTSTETLDRLSTGLSLLLSNTGRYYDGNYSNSVLPSSLSTSFCSFVTDLSASVARSSAFSNQTHTAVHLWSARDETQSEDLSG